MQKFNLKLIGNDDSEGSKFKLPATVSSAQARQSRTAFSPVLSQILLEVRRLIEGELSSSDADQTLFSDDLSSLIQSVSQRLGFELSSFERDELMLQLEREQRPFGVLQSLVDDDQVSDIIVSDFTRIAVQQGRRNSTTDLAFPDQGHYESFVEKLLLRAGTTYSTKKPIADGMIGT